MRHTPRARQPAPRIIRHRLPHTQHALRRPTHTHTRVLRHRHRPPRPPARATCRRAPRAHALAGRVRAARDARDASCGYPGDPQGTVTCACDGAVAGWRGGAVVAVMRCAACGRRLGLHHAISGRGGASQICLSLVCFSFFPMLMLYCFVVFTIIALSYFYQSNHVLRISIIVIKSRQYLFITCQHRPGYVRRHGCVHGKLCKCSFQTPFSVSHTGGHIKKLRRDSENSYFSFVKYKKIW